MKSTRWLAPAGVLLLVSCILIAAAFGSSGTAAQASAGTCVLHAANANLLSGVPTPQSECDIVLNADQNVASVQIYGSGYVGQLAAYEGLNFNSRTPYDGTDIRVAIPAASIVKSDASTGFGANASGIWMITAAPGSLIHIAFSSFTSGSASVVLKPGSSGSATISTTTGSTGGGGSVTQGTSPWVTQDTTLDGIVASSKLPISAASGSFVDGAITTLGLDADSATNGAGTVNAHLREIAGYVSGNLGTIATQLASGTNTVGAITNTSFTANAGTNLNTSSLALETGGNLATIATNTGASTSSIGSAVPSKGIYNGAIASTALPSAATAGNLVGAYADKFGRMAAVPWGGRELYGSQGTTITSSTSATTVVSAIASTFCDLTSCVVSNTSSTAIYVTLSDGTNSYVLGVPADGAPHGFALGSSVMPAASSNTAWTVTCSSSVASVYVVATFIKNH